MFDSDPSNINDFILTDSPSGRTGSGLMQVDQAGEIVERFLEADPYSARARTIESDAYYMFD